MSEVRVLQSLLAKTESRIEDLRRRLDIQQGIRDDLQEQLVALGGAVVGSLVPGQLNGRPAAQTPAAKTARIEPPKKVKAPRPEGGEANGSGQIDSWSDRIAEIMRRNGGTMRFGEIVEELERQGETELGRHKLGSRVFGVLRRRKTRFEKLSRGEYRLIA